MYATAAAEPLATPALVPRRQFQKVKEASLHSKPRGSARFVRGTLQAGDAGLHWPRVLPTWSVAIGQRSAVHTERLGVQQAACEACVPSLPCWRCCCSWLEPRSPPAAPSI